MDTYIRLGDRFKLDRQNKELIDIETGQIFTDENEIVLLLKSLNDDKEFNRSMEKLIRDTWGLKTALELHQHEWKGNSWFIKLYRTEMRNYKKTIQLTSNAGLLLFYMQDYIEYGTNRIAKTNGSDFTNRELEKLTGLSIRVLNTTFNELEEKHFIKRVGQKQARKIYFNPYLMSSGNEIEKETIKLFTNYKSCTPY